jgi:uncharacterized protein (TIRG00374 family)
VIDRSILRRISLGLGLLLGILLLALAFRQVDLASLMVALAKTNPYLVALAFLAVAATTVAKALRWGLLFYPLHGEVHFNNLLSAILVGQMMNSLLPARLGELARAYLIGETEGQYKLRALGTIVVEKLLDGLMLVLLLALLFLVMPLPDWLRIPGATAGLAIGGLLAAILLLSRQREKMLAVVDRCCRRLPVLDGLGMPQRLGALADGLGSLSAMEVNARLVAWSVTIWFLAAVTNYLTLLALRIEAPLALASLLVLVVLHLGLAVPSSPGRIGVFHYLCLLSLSVFGVERSLALAYALVLYFVVVLPIIVAGLFCLWKENITLYGLVKDGGAR